MILVTSNTGPALAPAIRQIARLKLPPVPAFEHQVGPLCGELLDLGLDCRTVGAAWLVVADRLVDWAGNSGNSVHDVTLPGLPARLHTKPLSASGPALSATRGS